MGIFQPTFIFAEELQQFGLPTVDSDQSDIMNLVGAASCLIDEHCGRTDGDGNGSLVYSTYSQRLLMQAPGRNLVQIPIKPLVGVSTATQLSLSGNMNAQSLYTGFIPNTVTRPDGTLSSFLSASGRYAYGRRDQTMGYGINVLNPLTALSLLSGQAAPWVAIDVAAIDYDPKTGDCWIPTGIQLLTYTEIVIVYNSGFDPLNMPKQIKMATAMAVKNMMMMGAGTTGLKSISLARSGASATFDPNIIDINIDKMLTAFKTVRAY